MRSSSLGAESAERFAILTASAKSAAEAAALVAFAELLPVTVVAWVRINHTETQTGVEPVPLADIGLAGKEADIDNSSCPR